MLELKSAFTIESCEAALKEFEQGPRVNSLLMPLRPVRKELGGEAAFTQLVITWAQRRRPHSTLLTYLSDESAADRFVDNLPGLAAAVCSDLARDYTSKRLVRPALLAAAFKKLAILDSPRPWGGSRGLGVDLLCVDHFDLGRPQIFYDDRLFRDEMWFRRIAPILFFNSMPQALRSTFNSTFIEEIGSLIFQLMQNTEVHARTDVSGNSIKPSLRGVTIRHRSVHSDVLLRRVGADRVFFDYVENMPTRAGGINKQFIELSIFDSGPGYAARWSGRPVSELTLEEEFSAVSTCFEAGASTRKGAQFGQGLAYVVRGLAAMKGLLRLRTGRLSLAADLGSSAPDDRGVPILRDTGGGELQKRGQVSGVLVTLFIPLGAP